MVKNNANIHHVAHNPIVKLYLLIKLYWSLCSTFYVYHRKYIAFAEHVPRRENYVLKSVDQHPESQFVIDESSDLDDTDVAPVETDIVPEAVQEVEAVVQGVKVSPQFLEAHYYSIYGGEKRSFKFH